MIFRDGEHKAIVGRNSCVKSDPTQKAAAAQTPTNNQPAAQVAKTSQKDKSFGAKLMVFRTGVEAISEEDMVTGQNLNVKDQEAAAKKAKHDFLSTRKSNGVKYTELANLNMKECGYLIV